MQHQEGNLGGFCLHHYMMHGILRGSWYGDWLEGHLQPQRWWPSCANAGDLVCFWTEEAKQRPLPKNQCLPGCPQGNKDFGLPWAAPFSCSQHWEGAHGATSPQRRTMGRCCHEPRFAPKHHPQLQQDFPLKT